MPGRDPEACRRFSASSLGCGLRKLPSAKYRIAAIRSRIPDAGLVHAGVIGNVQPDDSIQARRNTLKGKALYSYADKQKGVAYIGGDKAYKRYKQLAAQQYEMKAAYSKMLAHEDQVWSVHYE